MTLHPLNKKGNRYCGPAVLSMLTGLPAGEAVRKAKRKGKLPNKAIKGMTKWELQNAMGALGIVAKRDSEGNTARRGTSRPTVSQWSRDYQLPGRVYVLFIKWHFVIVKDDTYYDTQYPEGAPVAGIYRRQVNVAWWVTKR